MPDQTVQLSQSGGLTRDAVETLSRRSAEPAWMREFRLQAFAAYEQSPLPSSKNEEWRRTDLSGLRLDALTPFGASSPGPLPAFLQQTIDAMGVRSGLVIQADSRTIRHELDPALQRAGVVFTDLETALREDPMRVRSSFMQSVRPETKFLALHAALWSGGTFIYVPPGVEVTLPLLFFTWVGTHGTAIFPHTLLIADANSKVTLIEGLGSGTEGRQVFADSVVELALAEGAQVRHVRWQNWGPAVWEIGVIRAQLARDATVRSLLVAVGGKLAKTNVETMLRGQGASSEMLGLVFADDHQQFDFRTLQEHFAPHTTSDLLYKNAVKDHARSAFAGLIRVHPGAQKTNAFQANRNLLLSEGARADSDPKLEIMANDLRCTHGSATSRLNEEQLFYLMSRGLSRARAVRMAVEGFFAEVFDRVPLEQLKETLQQAIEAKMVQ